MGCQILKNTKCCPQSFANLSCNGEAPISSHLLDQTRISILVGVLNKQFYFLQKEGIVVWLGPWKKDYGLRDAIFNTIFEGKLRREYRRQFSRKFYHSHNFSPFYLLHEGVLPFHRPTNSIPFIEARGESQELRKSDSFNVLNNSMSGWISEPCYH